MDGSSTDVMQSAMWGTIISLCTHSHETSKRKDSVSLYHVGDIIFNLYIRLRVVMFFRPYVLYVLSDGGRILINEPSDESRLYIAV